MAALGWTVIGPYSIGTNVAVSLVRRQMGLYESQTTAVFKTRGITVSNVYANIAFVVSCMVCYVRPVTYNYLTPV